MDCEEGGAVYVGVPMLLVQDNACVAWLADVVLRLSRLRQFSTETEWRSEAIPEIWSGQLICY